MNKHIIAFLVLSAITAKASDFAIVVNKAENNYEIGVSSNIKYTDWEVYESNNCSVTNDWLPENVYNDVNYEKTTTCDEGQERYKETYSGETLLTREKETQHVLAVSHSEDLIGEMKARNCLEVLNAHGSVGDGNYRLTVNGTDHDNYCDMTNGGWTLAMRLKDSGQFSSGTLNRDNFWNSGSTMNDYTTNTFSQLLKSDTGFLGWDRIDDMLNNSYLELNVRGVNSLGDSVDEVYKLNNFNPIMTNNSMETGSLDGGGLYTISKKNDINTRNGWGTCGINSNLDVHVGLGLCVTGYNSSSPRGNEVQIWHYGENFGAYKDMVNVSFGETSSGITSTYNKVSTFDLNIFMK